MSTRMSPERLRAHQEMKRRALEVLAGAQGGDVQIKILRDRLGLRPEDTQAVRILELALRELRDEHKAASGKTRGYWRWAEPVQQPLPVAPAASPGPPWGPTTSPETVAAWLRTLSDETVCQVAEATVGELARRLQAAREAVGGGR